MTSDVVRRVVGAVRAVPAFVYWDLLVIGLQLVFVWWQAVQGNAAAVLVFAVVACVLSATLAGRLAARQMLEIQIVMTATAEDRFRRMASAQEEHAKDHLN